jgi:hypothetical protein
MIKSFFICHLSLGRIPIFTVWLSTTDDVDKRIKQTGRRMPNFAGQKVDPDWTTIFHFSFFMVWLLAPICGPSNRFQ